MMDRIKRRRKGRAAALLMSSFFLFLPGLEAWAQASAQAGPPVARLIRGPEALRGLPFFGPNVLPALRVDYDLAGVAIKVWSCRSTLVFGLEWSAPERAGAGAPRLRSLARPAGSVLALAGDGYTLFLESPADGPSLRRFALALERQFKPFFLNARGDAELSFPAFVDLSP